MAVATLSMLAVRRRSVSLIQRVLGWFREEPRLDRLYVLQVDFPVTEKTAPKLDAALEPLRRKYNLDFLVMEPGMKLTRFDDI